MATISDNYAAAVTIPITLHSLASSTTGVGRQSDIVDNTTNKYLAAQVSVSFMCGASPSNNGVVNVYLIRSNNSGTAIIDDGAGTGDAAWTRISAMPLGALSTGGSASSGQVLKGNFNTSFLGELGPQWAVGVVNSTGATSNGTAANFVVSYVGIKKDVA